jgi:hypothetical protein
MLLYNPSSLLYLTQKDVFFACYVPEMVIIASLSNKQHVKDQFQKTAAF